MDNKDRFSNAPVNDFEADAAKNSEGDSKTEQKLTSAVTTKLKIKRPALQGDKKRYLMVTLSIIIAFGLWLYVINAENPTITRTYSEVELDYMNQDSLNDSGLVATGIEEQYVRVVLEGKHKDLIKIDSDDIVAYVNMSSLSEGDNYVDISVKVPYSTELISVSPSRLKIHVERTDSAAEQVVVNFDGKAASGYEPHCVAQSAESVTVSGAKSQIQAVDHVSAVVSTSSLTDTAQDFEVKLKPVDSNGEIVPDIMLSTDTVTVTAQLYAKKTVDLKVETTGQVAEGYEVKSVVTPPTVVIAGPADIISGIKEVNAESVDISGLKKTSEIDIKVKLPEGVVLSDNVKELIATVSIKETENHEESKTFEYSSSDIVFENVPDGLSAEISGKVSLKVTGNEAGLNEIGSGDFTLTADCSGLSEGTSGVTLKVTLSQDAKDAGVTTDTPHAELSLKEE
ncbi:MAG: hypothetical protein K5767_08455 [Clostridia bacterium]|nr:hypothetical protein [Clostridia bacterium]